MSKFFMALGATLVAVIGLYLIINNMSTNTNLPTGQAGAPAGASGAVAKLETSLGNIEIELLPAGAPKTVENFTTLARKGFYDGLTFHRVIPGFMIQGGDPLCGKDSSPDAGPCGTGGPGYKFADEINAGSDLYKSGYQKGFVAMANSGPNTNGSQFFIMVASVPLPPNYTIFGRVKSGQDVADKISALPRNSSDRPNSPLIISRVTIQ